MTVLTVVIKWSQIKGKKRKNECGHIVQIGFPNGWHHNNTTQTTFRRVQDDPIAFQLQCILHEFTPCVNVFFFSRSRSRSDVCKGCKSGQTCFDPLKLVFKWLYTNHMELQDQIPLLHPAYVDPAALHWWFWMVPSCPTFHRETPQFWHLQRKLRRVIYGTDGKQRLDHTD